MANWTNPLTLYAEHPQHPDEARRDAWDRLTLAAGLGLTYERQEEDRALLQKTDEPPGPG